MSIVPYKVFHAHGLDSTAFTDILQMQACMPACMRTYTYIQTKHYITSHHIASHYMALQ